MLKKERMEPGKNIFRFIEDPTNGPRQEQLDERARDKFKKIWKKAPPPNLLTR